MLHLLEEHPDKTQFEREQREKSGATNIHLRFLLDVVKVEQLTVLKIISIEKFLKSVLSDSP